MVTFEVSPSLKGAHGGPLLPCKVKRVRRYLPMKPAAFANSFLYQPKKNYRLDSPA